MSLNDSKDKKDELLKADQTQYMNVQKEIKLMFSLCHIYLFIFFYPRFTYSHVFMIQPVKVTKMQSFFTCCILNCRVPAVIHKL